MIPQDLNLVVQSIKANWNLHSCFGTAKQDMSWVKNVVQSILKGNGLSQIFNKQSQNDTVTVVHDTFNYETHQLFK